MKKNTACIIINIILIAIILLLSQSSSYQMIELKLYDLRMHLRKPPLQDKRILFVEMDEEAIQNIGRWPWPRDVNANLIDTLDLLGAKQILFDVTFSIPSSLSIKQEGVDELLTKEKPFKDFINQLTQKIQDQKAVNKENVIDGLTEINQGIDDLFSKNIRSITKNEDLIFANALKSKNTFLGSKFDIAYDPLDIKRINEYEKIKTNFQTTKNNPFKNIRYFSNHEINIINLRLKIYSLLDKNINLDYKTIATALNLEPQQISPYFISIFEEIGEKKIKDFLQNNPSGLFKEFCWHYEIEEIETQQNLQKIWDKIINERLFAEKFSVDIKTSQHFLEAIKLDTPLNNFIQNMAGTGFLNGIPDQDGILRSIPLFINYHGKLYPHLAMASALKILQPAKIYFIPNKFFVLSGVKDGNRTKDIRIPIDHQAKTIINWAGKWQETYRHISCLDVYRLYSLRERIKQDVAISDDYKKLWREEKKLKSIIQDSICIIGLTAPGTHDYNPIPQESTYPMVGTHANVLNSILSEKFIKKIPNLYNLLILLIIGSILSISLSYLSSLAGFIVAFTLIIIFILIAIYLFNLGLWIDMASPLLFMVLSYLGITSFKFANEEKEKKWIKNVFSKYVAKEVIEEIIKDPTKLKLGGKRATISVLFSDIRSFTTYSEKRQPEEVVNILNEYLDEMTKIIFQNQGTLDKYVGDEIMAIFGAPKELTPEVSAQKAILTALAMMEKLHNLQEKWQKEGKEPLDIGIGINTGEMVVGNMGSHLRMDYTVIGDAVNLGARVEALTRQYNNHIIITEFTYAYVKDLVKVKPLESIKVKGKDIPVMIYELIGLN